MTTPMGISGSFLRGGAGRRARLKNRFSCCVKAIIGHLANVGLKLAPIRDPASSARVEAANDFGRELAITFGARWPRHPVSSSLDRALHVGRRPVLEVRGEGEEGLGCDRLAPRKTSA